MTSIEGVWKIIDASPDAIVIVDANGEEVASIALDNRTCDYERSNKIARLIAQAPAMAAILGEIAEIRDGLCLSCNTTVAKEGCCGCGPHEGLPEYERREKARSILRTLRGGE